MAKPFQQILDWIAKNFSNDASKMLITTGVIGWALSSAAQIGALLFNSKISKEQKSFLIPQEFADMVVNIGSFLLFTQTTKVLVKKLITSGKWASPEVKKYINKNKKVLGENVGKYNFDIEKYLEKESKALLDNYKNTLNLYTTGATVSAGIMSSNIITPIIRNHTAAKMQKNYINANSQTEVKTSNIQKLETPQTTFKGYGMRI